MTSAPTLFDALDLLDIPTEGARHGDAHDTEVESARAQLPNVSRQMRRCLLALASSDGLTDDELFAAVRGVGPKPISERYIAGTRRGQLRDLGLVEATETKRKSAKGRNALVWAVTERGLEAARKIREAGDG